MTTNENPSLDSLKFQEPLKSWTPELIDVHHVSEAIIALEKLANGPSKEAMKGEILAGLSKLPGVTGAKFTKDAEVLFLAYAKESQANRENLAKKLGVHPLIVEDTRSV